MRHEVVRQNNTNIWTMCSATKELLAQICGGEGYARGREIVFTEDYSGTSRRDVSAANSSWDIIKDEFEDYDITLRLKANPLIVDGVNALQGRLRNAKGQVNFAVHPSCVELIKDLEEVTEDDLRGIENQKRVGHPGDRTHAVA